MPKLTRAAFATIGLLAAGCGGGSGGGGGITGGPATAPTPGGPTTSRPTVYVGTVEGGSEQFPWNGDVSFEQQSGPAGMQLHLTQTGAQVTGTVNLFSPQGGAGLFAGTLSGNMLTFNFSIGNQSQGCGNTVTGIASVATSTMTGTFNGQRCDTTPYKNATFTLSLPSPYRTSPYPVAGTWTANVPAALGGGRWTFTIAEAVTDVTSSSVSGSVSVSGSTLALGAGSLGGPVTNTFPGPNTIARMAVAFSGSCASSVTVNVGFPGGNPAFDGSQMTGGVSGTTCNGPLPQGLGLNLLKNP